MSSKLESFDLKQTTWEGLWYHPEHLGFSSARINLSKLKAFKGTVILYVRKNKFYKEGTNRPNYTFCIRDANADAPVTPDIISTAESEKYAKFENGEWKTSDGQRLITYDEALSALCNMYDDLAYEGQSPDDCIPSSYL